METLHFILCSYGLTFLLAYGSIFNFIRPTKGKLGDLFHCPLCLGFWIGIFLWAMNGQTELFSFDVSAINFFFLGWLSSGTSYILNMIFGDQGIKVLRNIEVVKNDEWYLHDEVDDSAS